MIKGLFPCIWLLQGKAVRGFKDTAVVSGDPAALVSRYAQAGAEGVILFDLSSGDADHEAAIDLIRKICEENVIKVIGAGNVRRMEDVKKLIYAGCDLAALNLSRESNRILAREVSERFGQDRIAGCYQKDALSAAEWEKLAPWLSMRILLDAGEDNAEGNNTNSNSAGISAADGTGIPVIACVETFGKPENEDSGNGDPGNPAKAIDRLLSGKQPGTILAGVSGTAVNRSLEEDDETVDSLRILMQAAGIAQEEEPLRAAFTWQDFKKGPDGLLPVVVQEEATGQVLMVAYMNEEAYRMTVETGRMTYFSRSRQSLWIKGETSGHYQYVRSLHGDCDMDTLLACVVQIGAACHTGSHSCFFNEVQKIEENRPARMRAAGTSISDALREDYQTIIDRRDNPKEGSYTNYLFDKGIDKMLKKLGEENTEIVIAAKNPGENEIIYEIADYLYHLEVVMAEKGVDWEDITRELIRRQK